MTSTIKTWQYRVKVNGIWEGAAMKLEIADLRLALHALEKQEPVGWFIDCTVGGKSVGDYQLAAREHWGDYETCVPLYSAPVAQPAEPLTDAEISKWWASENGLEDCEMCKIEDFFKVVRAIEAHHGIKASTNQPTPAA